MLFSSSREVIETLFKRSAECVLKYGNFLLCVAGGSLVSFLEEALPTEHEDYSRWLIFFVDERLVPSDSPESNCGSYIRDVFVHRHFDISHQIVYPKSLDHFEEGTGLYDNIVTEFSLEIRKVFEKVRPDFVFNGGNTVRFDMCVLGAGADGHFSSLFGGNITYREELARSCMYLGISGGGSEKDPCNGPEHQLVVLVKDSPKMPKVRMCFSLLSCAHSDIVFVLPDRSKRELSGRLCSLRDDYSIKELSELDPAETLCFLASTLGRHIDLFC